MGISHPILTERVVKARDVVADIFRLRDRLTYLLAKRAEHEKLFQEGEEIDDGLVNATPLLCSDLSEVYDVFGKVLSLVSDASNQPALIKALRGAPQ